MLSSKCFPFSQNNISELTATGAEIPQEKKITNSTESGDSLPFIVLEKTTQYGIPILRNQNKQHDLFDLMIWRLVLLL